MAIVNISEPTNNTNYTVVLDNLKKSIESSLTLFNNVGDTYINIPENALMLAPSSTDLVFRQYISSSWTDVTKTFLMTVNKLLAPGGTQETGAYFLDLANATGVLPATSFNDVSHGDRAGGTFHAVAVAGGANGFLSGTDKSKLDGLVVHTGTTIEALYDSKVPFATSGEIAAGTEITTRRYSPSRITSSISAKMQKTEALIHTSVFDKGNIPGTTTVDAANGMYQKMVLTGNAEITSFSSVGVYTLYLHVTQDATGDRTLTLPTGLWKRGTVVTISAAANTLSIVTVHYDGTNLMYDVARNMS